MAQGACAFRKDAEPAIPGGFCAGDDAELIFVNRKLHFAVLNETAAARQLVAEPDNQEQRNADIGCRHAIPVDAVVKECLVVLTSVMIRQSTKAKIGPSGKKPER